MKNAIVLTGWWPLSPRSMSAAGPVSDRAYSPDSRTLLHFKGRRPERTSSFADAIGSCVRRGPGVRGD
jgi:hypothetical protein